MVEQQSTSSLLLLASKKMNRNRIKANNENKDDEPTAVILYFILCSFLGPAIYGPKKRKNKRRMKIVTAVDRFFPLTSSPLLLK